MSIICLFIDFSAVLHNLKNSKAFVRQDPKDSQRFDFRIAVALKIVFAWLMVIRTLIYIHTHTHIHTNRHLFFPVGNKEKAHDMPLWSKNTCAFTLKSD